MVQIFLIIKHIRYFNSNYNALNDDKEEEVMNNFVFPLQSFQLKGK